MSEASGGGRAPAVRRAAQILAELAAHPEPVSVAWLSRRLGMPKSSVADVCGVLLDDRVLVRDVDGRVQLGARISELARGFVGGTPLLERFALTVARVRGLAEQTVVLAVRLGLDAVYLAVRPGARPLPLTLRPGMRLPAWSTGTGRALLSALSDAEIERLHAAGAPASPSGRPFDIEDLLAAVRLARSRGYASNADLGEMALAGTAALVYGVDGPLAAVGSVVELGAADPDGDAEAVQALAHRLTSVVRAEPY